MAERYTGERLEAACARAVRIGNPTRKSVEAILKSGLDKVALPSEAEPNSVKHENIRGGDYFDRGEATASSADEIEERYLTEERLAIKNEERTDTDPRPPSGGPSKSLSDTSEQSNGIAAAAESRASQSAEGPLEATLRRLRSAWESPNGSQHDSLTQQGEEDVPPDHDKEDRMHAERISQIQYEADIREPTSFKPNQGWIQ
jgi:hypothetical protein